MKIIHKFIPSMNSRFTLKRSFLNNPDFSLDVLDAVDRTREDGQARLIGSIVERFIVERSEVSGKVRIVMVTGFQVFEEATNEKV